MREVRYRFPGDAEDGKQAKECLDKSQLEVISTTDMKAESAAYIDDSRGLHKFGNASKDSPSISLHIYSVIFSFFFSFFSFVFATNWCSFVFVSFSLNLFCKIFSKFLIIIFDDFEKKKKKKKKKKT